MALTTNRTNYINNNNFINPAGQSSTGLPVGLFSMGFLIF